LRNGLNDLNYVAQGTDEDLKHSTLDIQPEEKHQIYQELLARSQTEKQT